MEEVNLKAQIHKDWIAVKAAREEKEKWLNEEDFGDPRRRATVKEWNELLDRERDLYKALTGKKELRYN